MVKLALYKGKGKIGNAVTRWWTGSIYSHCELVVCGICYSSSLMDGGVRAKQIDLTNGNWDLIELPWVSPAQIINFYAATRGNKYDWVGLFRGQLFNRGRSDYSKSFCSEWCADSLGFPNAEALSPAMLKELCEFVTSIYWLSNSK